MTDSPRQQLAAMIGRFDPAIQALVRALHDPHRLLQGRGNQGRFVRLESASMLDRREIADLLTAAIAEADTPLPTSGRGSTVIKAVSPNQRRRRSTVSR